MAQLEDDAKFSARHAELRSLCCFCENKADNPDQRTNRPFEAQLQIDAYFGRQSTGLEPENSHVGSCK